MSRDISCWVYRDSSTECMKNVLGIYWYWTYKFPFHKILFQNPLSPLFSLAWHPVYFYFWSANQSDSLNEFKKKN